ncbi:hypothetical protein FACS189462_3490 [Spirochaetia bacterium]|nr:hypothetical protein FACS189462_3490 [Spirochaetia bacterium]
MKKSPVLWLLPLAAVLFFSIPSNLLAMTDAKEKQLVSLQDELQKKGKLSNSKQRNLDSLRAEKQAEEAAKAKEMEVAQDLSEIASGNNQSNTAADEYFDNENPLSSNGIDDGKLVTDALEASLAREAAAREAAIARETAAREADIAAINEAIANASKEAADREAADKPNQVKPSDAWDTDYTDDKGNYVIPKWVTHPAEIAEYEVVGVGTARSGSDRLSIQLADTRARQDIALQVSANVKAMLTDFAEIQGSGIDEFESLQASRSQMVGRQLIDVDLKGVRVEQRLKAKDNTWWVMVKYVDPVKKAAFDKTEQGKARAAAEAQAVLIKAAAEAEAAKNSGLEIKPAPAVNSEPADHTDRAREALDLMDKELEKVTVPQSGTTVPPAAEARAQPEVQQIQSTEDAAKEQLSKKSPLKSTVVVASE